MFGGVGANGIKSSVLGLLVWLGTLAGYCALQTFANTVSVELQDFILISMPLFAAASVVLALKVGPPLPLVGRVVFGGVAALAFGHLYYQFFRGVIVETLHSWQRDEGLLMYLATFVGLLIWVGAALGAIAGGWLGAKARPRHPIV